MTKGKLLGLGIAFALAATASAANGVVKTKTKSNQSNDRSMVTTVLESEFERFDLDRNGQLDGTEQAALATSPPAGEAARGVALKGVDVSLGSSGVVRLVFSSALDRNGDGLVGRAEWLADGLAQVDLADADHDGSLTEAEAVRFGWNVKSSETR